LRLRGLLGAAALCTVLPSIVPAESEARIHEVRPGETLWTIAAITVGDPTLWPALYLANRDQIKDPALVYPGQQLAIPEIDPGERNSLRREAEALTSQP
jgi:nucleoid-associated protein YgaU